MKSRSTSTGSEDACDAGQLGACKMSPILKEMFFFLHESSLLGDDIHYFFEKPWKWNDAAETWIKAGRPDEKWSARWMLANDAINAKQLGMPFPGTGREKDLAEALAMDVKDSPSSRDDTISKFTGAARRLGIKDAWTRRVVDMMDKTGTP